MRISPNPSLKTMMRTVLLGIACLAATGAMGQQTSPWQLHARIGTNLGTAGGRVNPTSFVLGPPNNVYINDHAGNRWRLGGMVGLDAHYRVNRRISWRFGLQLEQKGSRVEVTSASIYVPDAVLEFSALRARPRVALTYLTIPVSVGYQWRPFGVYGGLYTGLKLAERQAGQVPVGKESFRISRRNMGRYSPLEVGYQAGVTYTPALLSRFSLDAQFSQSLTNVAATEGWAGGPTPDLRNRVVQLALRYRLTR